MALHAQLLGQHIAAKGNVVSILDEELVEGDSRVVLVSFPVKHNWYERASLQLIMLSANTLVRLADLHGWHNIVLPRPGCGNGHLNWGDVKPVLAPILDDRFHVITFS